ncbi:hypothetical protein [Brucella pseudogrignonensis]|uniref:Uncharacterized protein n=1 Tax=Brucella pseudogrignonensis TaxID=419475 RepID=A0ABU1M5G1_9HYPH|nr:hypothetical protein [Brucella pseudogrignonensis]MDR6431282.1 hypothetical protein [Brucella pseudogrignonensis]
MKGFKDWFIAKHGFWPGMPGEKIEVSFVRLCDALADFVDSETGRGDWSEIVTADLAIEPIKISYTNYRGENSIRTITPIKPWYGSTEWHPEPQWLLTAFDHEKQANRDFALKDFGYPAPSPRAQALEEVISELVDAQHKCFEWTGSAFLADELDATEDTECKAAIYKDLCALGNTMSWLQDQVRALSSQPVAGRRKTVDELAAYLCDEFDFDLNPVHGASWPEHENDEGKREGGFVRLQPSDVQAYARENAKRILTFLGLAASPGASATRPTGGSDADA